MPVKTVNWFSVPVVRDNKIDDLFLWWCRFKKSALSLTWAGCSCVLRIYDSFVDIWNNYKKELFSALFLQQKNRIRSCRIFDTVSFVSVSILYTNTYLESNFKRIGMALKQSTFCGNQHNLSLPGNLPCPSFSKN